MALGIPGGAVSAMMLGALLLYGIHLFVRLTKMPIYVLAPSILVLCVVGAFAIANRFFDIWVLFIFGAVGYLMFKTKFPLAPAILGVILGPIAEVNFRRALQTDPDWTIFLTRPIPLFLSFYRFCLWYILSGRIIAKRRDWPPRRPVIELICWNGR